MIVIANNKRVNWRDDSHIVGRTGRESNTGCEGFDLMEPLSNNYKE